MKRAILSIFALMLASQAFAQPPGGGAPGGAGQMPDDETIFANNDGNGDGEITKAEADAAGLPLSENWDMFDTDGDGKVVAAELDAVRGGAGGAGARAGGPGARAGRAGARAGGPGAAAPAPAADDTEEEDEE
jgi:hypothetical protein